MKVVFKHFPLSFHKDAPLASEACLAAGAQGKFWEMHDLLFKNQRALKRPDLEKYAQELGLNLDTFKKALDAGTYPNGVPTTAAERNATRRSLCSLEPELMAALDRGDVDLVVGSRFLGRADYPIPALRRAGMGLFARLTSALTGRPITDPTSGFQALDRAVLRFYLRDFYPYDYPDADMLLRVHYAGLRFAEAPVVMRAGPAGQSMHRGLRPVYYVYKLLLSMALLWFGRNGESAGPA